MSRATNLFCYDPVVFFYLLTVGAGIVIHFLFYFISFPLLIMGAGTHIHTPARRGRGGRAGGGRVTQCDESYTV
jgi:hypothetical protein